MVKINNVFLYDRCRNSPKSEAYLPCSFALWKIQLLKFWEENETFIKVTDFKLFSIFLIIIFEVVFVSGPR